MEYSKVKRVIEAALFAAAKPLTVKQLESLFDLGDNNESATKDQIRQALKELQEEYAERGVELRKVSSGYRMQTQQELEPWVSKLWEEKPPRYSRALLETLSIIAYRQPITRGEIEEIRGVAVSTNITKTLQERDWVRVVGHRDVPGKPAMFGTTKEFLDYFNLKHLDELPTLAELKDLDAYHPELDLEGEGDQSKKASAEANEENAEVEVEVENSEEVSNDDADASAESNNVVELEAAAAETPEQVH